MLAPILLYELFFQVTLLVFSILLVALYFQKKMVFKAVLIAYLSFQFVAPAVDTLLVDSRPHKAVTTDVRSRAAPTAAGALVPLVLWVLYVLRSKRVKLTFVN